MGQNLKGIAKQAARLLLIELFVPGGTLFVLSILLASRVPAISDRFAALPLLLAASKRSGHQDNLVTYYGLRRIR
jgi:hypothetical protein